MVEGNDEGAAVNAAAGAADVFDDAASGSMAGLSDAADFDADDDADADADADAGAGADADADADAGSFLRG
jgi:hypothetical protein